MTHDRPNRHTTHAYTALVGLPLSIRRRFMSLAGMLEIADREFQAIQDEDERVRAQIREDEDLERVVKLQPTVARTMERLIVRVSRAPIPANTPETG